MGAPQGGCQPLCLHLSTPGSPQTCPEVLVLTQEARDCPPPPAPAGRLGRGPLGPVSSSSVPNVTSFNSTGASGSLCPAQATSGPQGASSLPVGSHAAWWVAAVACGFSRRREFPQTPAPPAHHTVAARYKPGRPPVLRLPDQVTPALPQPCLLPGSWPPRRPLHLCFLACIGESGFRQPFRGVLCADCRPCPTCSFLEPQTPDPTPQSSATFRAQQGQGLGGEAWLLQLRGKDQLCQNRATGEGSWVWGGEGFSISVLGRAGGG